MCLVHLKGQFRLPDGIVCQHIYQRVDTVVGVRKLLTPGVQVRTIRYIERSNGPIKRFREERLKRLEKIPKPSPTMVLL